MQRFSNLPEVCSDRLLFDYSVARACICVLEAGAKAGGVGLNIASAEAPTWCGHAF